MFHIESHNVPMDLLRHLEYFLAVADARSFSQAAENLGMAQPPLSQRIRALEQHLGVELFDRSRRQIQLTEPGRLLTAEARTMLQMANDLPAVLHSASAQPEAVIALPPTMPTDVLTELARALTTAFGMRIRPDVVPVSTRTSSQSAYLLEPGDGDVSTVVVVPLGLALDPAHPLLRNGVTPHPSDFIDGQIILLDEDSWQEEHLVSTLEGYGLPGRCIRTGGRPATVATTLALDNAACVTDPLHAASHGLTWLPATESLTRRWQVRGRNAKDVASTVQRVLDEWCSRG